MGFVNLTTAFCQYGGLNMERAQTLKMAKSNAGPCSNKQGAAFAPFLGDVLSEIQAPHKSRLQNKRWSKCSE